MIRLAFIFSFIISVASAALGLLLSNDLRRRNIRVSIYSILLYQQIFIFTFAFYGIWVPIFSKLFFSAELISQSIIEKISTLNTLFAIPFLMLSWWFLISIFLEIKGVLKRKFKVTLSLIISISILIPTYLILNNESTLFNAFIQLFFIENIVVSVLVSAIILSLKSNTIKKDKRVLLSGTVLLIGLLTSFGAKYHSLNNWITIALILFFFVSQVWYPLAFRLYIVLQPSYDNEAPSFDDFYLKYEISKREAEIISEICVGLTNKEIADKLFITLQTVKDHTSRIYLKTEVKNRTQLANLARDFTL